MHDPAQQDGGGWAPCSASKSPQRRGLLGRPQGAQGVVRGAPVWPSGQLPLGMPQMPACACTAVRGLVCNAVRGLRAHRPFGCITCLLVLALQNIPTRRRIQCTAACLECNAVPGLPDAGMPHMFGRRGWGVAKGGAHKRAPGACGACLQGAHLDRVVGVEVAHGEGRVYPSAVLRRSAHRGGGRACMGGWRHMGRVPASTRGPASPPGGGPSPD